MTLLDFPCLPVFT